MSNVFSRNSDHLLISDSTSSVQKSVSSRRSFNQPLGIEKAFHDIVKISYDIEKAFHDIVKISYDIEKKFHNIVNVFHIPFEDLASEYFYFIIIIFVIIIIIIIIIAITSGLL